MKTVIYNAQGERVVALNYAIESFKQDPKKFFPPWEASMIASDIEYRNPKVVNGQLIEKTRVELVEEGIETLHEGEILRFKVMSLTEGGAPVEAEEKEIIFVPRPAEMLKPVWESPEWVESATEEEIAEHNLSKAKLFYSKEKEYYELVDLDYELELVTEEEMQEVKAYMRAINPYYSHLRMTRIAERPLIFDRYK